MPRKASRERADEKDKEIIKGKSFGFSNENDRVGKAPPAAVIAVFETWVQRGVIEVMVRTKAEHGLNGRCERG